MTDDLLLRFHAVVAERVGLLLAATEMKQARAVQLAEMRWQLGELRLAVADSQETRATSRKLTKR